MGQQVKVQRDDGGIEGSVPVSERRGGGQGGHCQDEPARLLILSLHV